MKRTFLLLIAASALLAWPPSSEPQAQANAAERFNALYTREWNWRQAQYSGLEEDADRTTAPGERLPKVDPATQVERIRYWRSVLKDLGAIPAAELSAEDQVNYAIYRAQVEALEASASFRDYEKPFNSDSSFWAEVTSASKRPLRNLADYRAYVKWLADIPRYFAEQTMSMRAGLARGFSVPRVTLTGRDASISAIADVTDPEKNPFFEPFKKSAPEVHGNPFERVDA